MDRFKKDISTTKVDGDSEETDRRAELARYAPIDNGGVTTTPNGRCSTFKQIEEESQQILAKNPVARFIDKGGDSGNVAGFIERLRKALLRYQVRKYHSSEEEIVDKKGQISHQQAIYCQVTHLTVREGILSFNTGRDRRISSVIFRCALEAP